MDGEACDLISNYYKTAINLFKTTPRPLRAGLKLAISYDALYFKAYEEQ